MLFPKHQYRLCQRPVTGWVSSESRARLCISLLWQRSAVHRQISSPRSHGVTPSSLSVPSAPAPGGAGSTATPSTHPGHHPGTYSSSKPEKSWAPNCRSSSSEACLRGGATKVSLAGHALGPGEKKMQNGEKREGENVGL